MKPIDVKANINQFLQTIPESSQQFVRGGTLSETVTANTDPSAKPKPPTIAGHGYILVKKLNSGG